MSRIKTFLEDHNFFNMTEEEQEVFLSDYLTLPEPNYSFAQDPDNFDKVKYVKSILPVDINYYLDTSNDTTHPEEDIHVITLLPEHRIRKDIIYYDDISLDGKNIPAYIEWLGEDYDEQRDWLNDTVAICNFIAAMRESMNNSSNYFHQINNQPLSYEPHITERDKLKQTLLNIPTIPVESFLKASGTDDYFSWIKESLEINKTIPSGDEDASVPSYWKNDKRMIRSEAYSDLINNHPDQLFSEDIESYISNSDNVLNKDIYKES